MEYVNENIVWEYVDCRTDYTTLVSGRCGNAEWGTYVHLRRAHLILPRTVRHDLP